MLQCSLPHNGAHFFLKISNCTLPFIEFNSAFLQLPLLILVLPWSHVGKLQPPPQNQPVVYEDNYSESPPHQAVLPPCHKDQKAGREPGFNLPKWIFCHEAYSLI